jgi:pimeloyl-ACP methyl ester carboxylesterase
MRTVMAPDGVALAVHEHGGRGRPTIFCHATGLHGAVWAPMATALGDGFERWALDFRAHGASAVPPGTPLPWTAMRDDLLAVIDHLQPEPGELLGVGHSMGGAVLLLAEQLRPGTFAGLWLFEPIVPVPAVVASGEDRSDHMSEGARRRRPSFASVEAALVNYASKPPLNVARADALDAYVRHGLVEGEDGQAHLACRPEDEARIYEEAARHDAYDHLAEVRCPVLIAGGGEPDGPLVYGIAAMEHLPRGRLEVHQHLSHFGPLEAPAELAASLRAFAASL